MAIESTLRQRSSQNLGDPLTFFGNPDIRPFLLIVIILRLLTLIIIIILDVCVLQALSARPPICHTLQPRIA